MKAGFSYFPAPAKLNLFLHVTGQRADGYHLLQTVFRFIDYADEVGLRVTRGGTVRRVSPVRGVSERQDLTLQAACLLKQASGCPLGVEIDLVKRLPLGGGLGGGSSDAATTLIALNRLWSTGLSVDQLQALAVQLGADVPVFIFGRSAFAEGIGEHLLELPLKPAWYLVIVPQVAVSTAEIFAAPELTRNTKAIKISAFSVDQGHNDLQPVACRRYTQIARSLEWLEQFGKAAMSGSGASVFSAFDSERSALAALEQMPAGMEGFVARGLDRHPLYVAPVQDEQA
ncbi:MAG: 4-(cytidine 5'-diphospho)-2-C-methyl-D-erythritol kinase [Betaproteobacteria bacterium]|jgi:4-diphosphocytidyl-2-C-methyl-D-erythritol kinase|nr:MAG: 4-(cytidine 5'-diphospho)-2-C-methyl-D-erythritol kinase [Betaproteobacteria bacterium]